MVGSSIMDTDDFMMYPDPPESLIKARQDYEKEWPNYCRSCDGWGGWHGYIYVDGRAAAEDYDICDTCIGHEKCPRCGVVIPMEHPFHEEGEDCPHCGWGWGRKAGDGFPQW